VLSNRVVGSTCDDFVKDPLPSLIYKRSASAAEEFGNSLLPLHTYKSRSPSPSTSTNILPESSDNLSSSNTLETDNLNDPSGCCKNNTAGFPREPPIKISSRRSPLTSPVEILGPSLLIIW